MSRKRWDRPNGYYDDYGGHREYRRGNSFFIMNFVFEMLGLGIKIAFTILGSVFEVFGSILSSGNNRRNRPPVNTNMGNNANSNGNNSNNSNGNHGNGNNSNSDYRNTSNQYNANSNTNNSKQHNESRDQGYKAERNTDRAASRSQNTSANASAASKDDKAASDWNIVIFILTLIPVIVFLAIENLILAGASVIGGIILMIIYNIVRGIVRASKKKKIEKEACEEAHAEAEETETEKLIKEAFDKVYIIRKNLNKVSNTEIRAKVENLCSMSEKIIGEVRTNPENIKVVRKFFYYYLDAFNDIFNRYLRIYNFSNSSEEIDKTIAETENSFNDIEKIFKDLCEDLIENDAMNIKATINVMKNS